MERSMEYIALVFSRDRIADGFNFPFCTYLCFSIFHKKYVFLVQFFFKLMS